MIHVKRTRLNASYFPDDYDEDKEIQDYEPHDNLTRSFLPIKKLPMFFIELVKKWPQLMSDKAYDYFYLKKQSSPIDVRDLSIEMDAYYVKFTYSFRKDVKEDNNQLKETVEREFLEWINTDLTDNATRYTLAIFLSQQITFSYNNVLEGAIPQHQYDMFMSALAASFDMSSRDFTEALIDSCQLESRNTWTDFEYLDEDTENSLFLYFYKQHTTEELWLACTYTNKYTGFEPKI